ncbi:MAG: type I methionyl aminopeptidase [Bacillota bacterium]|nr:type I methionyl aminopeptidase [Bacillota bacterium]
MIIKTEAEAQAMQEIGHICALVLRKMGEALEPGITTLELDAIGAALLKAEGAVSAPIKCYDFPGHNCISVNEVVAHGIPSERVIAAGDIVNIDVSACKNGFFSDNGRSFAVPPVKSSTRKLLDCCERALARAISVAVAGAPLNCLGREVEKEARRHGFKTIKNLCGHGVGHTLHDDPDSIYNYYEKRDKRLLTAGLVLAIEPFISAGEDFVDELDDGWTLVTPSRSQVVQFEHTVMVREGEEPLILTPR